MNRQERKEMAEQTLEVISNGFYHNSRGEEIWLAADVNNKVYDAFYLDEVVNKKKSVYEFTDESTTKAIRRLSGGKLGVLNFASAMNPGGGFLKGSNAQEESIARVSTLYKFLIQEMDTYYEYNRTGDFEFYADRAVYSGGVELFRQDDGRYLSHCLPCNILTIPAVNTNKVKNKGKINEHMLKRIYMLCSIFANEHDDTLILGAFGCGVFGNNISDVAGFFHTVLCDYGLETYFKHICFALNDERTKLEFMRNFK